MELRHINFQYVDVFTYLGTQHTIGILWKLPHVRLIEFYLLHFQSLSSFQRSRGGGRAKISSHGLVFLLTGLHPGAYPESPHQIKRCFQCSYHLGVYKISGACVRNWKLKPNIWFQDIYYYKSQYHNNLILLFPGLFVFPC